MFSYRKHCDLKCVAVNSGFLSESEVLRENDAPSTSSFPYDDIEEAQLLTSQAAAAAAGASGDNLTHDSAPDEGAGKF